MGGPRRRRYALVCRLLLLLALLSLASPVAPAPDPATELKQAQEREQEILRQRQKAESQLEKVYLDMRATKARLEVLDQEIYLISGRLQVLDVQLKVTGDELVRLQVSLKEAEQRYQARKGLAARRIRSIHERGRVTYLNVLFGSTGFGDFTGRLDALEVILAYDRRILGEIRDLRRDLDQKRQGVADRQAELTQMQTEAKEQKQAAEIKAAQTWELGLALDQQRADLLARITAYEKEQAQVEEQIYEIQRRMARAAGKFVPASPLKRRLVITDDFGPRIHPVYGVPSVHGGTDFACSTGDPVLAIEDGVVIYRGYDQIYGNRLVVDHGGGIASWYAHLQGFNVQVNAAVKQGQTLGTCDSTGLSTGAHLHLEIRVENDRQDPMKYLSN